jgi:polyhydroxyalkanoate synthase
MAAVAPEGGLFARLDPVSLGSSLLAVARRAALHPYAASGAFWQYAATLAGIGPEAVARWSGRGADDKEPGAAALAKDKRFADRTWRDNPVFFAIGQAYFAAVGLTEDLLAVGRGDSVTDAKARLASDLILAALAPTNYLATNPAALKRAFETGGASVVAGARNFLDDLKNNKGMPRQVDTRPF